MSTRVIVRALAVGVLAGSAQASIVDLTTAHSQGTVNGAIFRTADFQPAGTGFIHSFVRLQRNGTEQGYNTSGRPVAFDEITDPNFTRNLRLSEVPTTTISGTPYYQFNLDINEPNGGGQNLLSLDRVKIFTSSTGSQTTSNIASLGTLRYDLDAGSDSWIRLDYNLGSGSGQGDMNLLVPTSFFAGAAANDFLYLYSMFGENHGSAAGFEEWAVLIPLPPAVWAGGLLMGLVGLRSALRRRADW